MTYALSGKARALSFSRLIWNMYPRAQSSDCKEGVLIDESALRASGRQTDTGRIVAHKTRSELRRLPGLEETLKVIWSRHPTDV